MPYHVDFSRLSGRNELTVNPKGWIVPISIEYAYGYIGNVMYFFWRLKNTQHTFRISAQELNASTEGKYEKHIESFLEEFRKEYLSWVAQGFTEEWMVEYHREYRKYIQF